MKDLGDELDVGTAAVIVIGESRIEEQLEAALTRSNKLIEKQIHADADELEREIDAAAKEGATTEQTGRARGDRFPLRKEVLPREHSAATEQGRVSGQVWSHCLIRIGGGRRDRSRPRSARWLSLIGAHVGAR